MRRLVPGCLYLLFFGVLSVPILSHAQTFGCNDARSFHQDSLGKYAASVLPRVDSVFKAEVSSTCGIKNEPRDSVAQLLAQGEALVSGGSGRPSAYDSARQCCQNLAGCGTSLRDSMSVASRDALAAPLNTKGMGQKEAFEATALKNASRLEYQESLIAACMVRAKYCAFRAKVISEGLTAQPTCNGNAACSTLNTKLKKLANDCENGLNPSAGIASAQAIDEELGKSVAGVQSVEDGTEKKSGIGINPAVAGMLLSTLQQLLMRQDESDEEPYHRPEDPPAMDCASNPAIAGCTELPRQVAWGNLGDGSTMVESSAGNGGFNMADSDPAGSGQDFMPASVSDGGSVSSGGVPNGGGGGIPGGGGGGVASLGGGGGRAGAGSESKSNTDIMHGERSGGYAATNSSMSMEAGGSGGFSGYGRQGVAPDDQAMNLAQFLPGGAKDPARAVAGLNKDEINRRQINTSEVNIWNRISDHFKVRCNQGLLRDCAQ